MSEEKVLEEENGQVNCGGSVVSDHSETEILDVVQPPLFGRGICRDEPLSKTGKKLQLFKMLCLTVIPIIGLWGYTVYTLADILNSRAENDKQRSSVYYSIDVGQLVHRLQVERDMSVLYLSELGPETRTFLLAEYINTDRTIDRLSYWPGDLDKANGAMFLSKANFRDYLAAHRQILSRDQFSIQDEIDFYSRIIDTTIYWLYNTITESKFSLVWKILVAYQKLASAKENVGVERALGTMFYSRGGFESHSYFETYNKRLHSFRAHMKTAGMYSEFVKQIYNVGLREQNNGTNITSIIESFRTEIQNVENTSTIDIAKSRYWFDNMTIYMDTLLDIQTQMAQKVIKILDVAIEDLTIDLAVYAILLVVVILMCPLVILATESLTSSIQIYALTLVDKTNELASEKARKDGLLYQMVPRQIANRLKKQKKVEAEYFKSVTVCFADVYSFGHITVELTPKELITLLGSLHNTVDNILEEFDAFKVETINDSFMVASGLPHRSSDRHATEIANFSLKMLNTVTEMKFCNGHRTIKLRIGIHTGPCMAGIIGFKVPKYCLFGETINLATRIKANSTPNKIHISNTTNTILSKYREFKIEKKGDVTQQGKTDIVTYWLVRKSGDANHRVHEHDTDKRQGRQADGNEEDCPGEIASIQESNEYVPMKSNGKSKDDNRNTARVAPTVTEKEKEKKAMKKMKIQK
ncbi:Guanylate cyclase 32E,Retinal guanylyl cyclase 1,Receptor-type guanylate cyclase gcy-28,Atrial natriuretic peptide receptor 1,Retinal guanylyl cyclase 2,Olfactory guanylyl cyclase GC-D,Atrial natriuretic peptide receptor 2,Receptor-type guanylate cyclase gcy-13,Receptor-type guanylate cyclase Gyc76C,Guanylyl cyclase GC-E [Mytilus coruscus]|uniref:Guanylate cyclase domain-containing protein n=1 Tax=Mytilus coruscus TaxID=42192 RepID=A0A6J8BJN6_MYTCO|nr:Guanylate cyclase 32E,Retinal guanylyl cyclase 1,Receptor-type guanylate cyclase gcy-28,Atrial natriuretic peptide receptor 1,Retinal guanylyl cyclase 2,Olfactory guanylyl cyclase GC-D,Atrial natriuretic peptide receptor 2,Receptor-type guanylate cyclase gcy-13,Receptor-type guanylate cyclase Gyc76C,Guanylyl cyclase GC-E [Mytilus coruscus]